MSSSRHIKIKERHLLADRIERNGIGMPPCSNCLRSERSCIVAPGHRRCNECTRRNSKCDGCAPTPVEWEKLRKEEERLEAEEEAAAAQEQEAFARRMRLRKQQKALKTRGAEMLRRGLQSLDELEAAEELERSTLAKSTPVPMSPPTTSSGVLDLGEVLFAVLSPGFFDRLGVGADTPPASLDS